MPLNQPLALTSMALACAAALAGCQQPKVIHELPMHPLISKSSPDRPARPAARTPVRRRPQAVPTDWIPTAPARQWKWIVVHHSASDFGSAELFDKWHRAQGWDELGYHFVITNGKGGPAGGVQVGGRWSRQKWGAHCKVPGNAYNERGIGICLVGDFRSGLPAPAQLASLRRLVTFLANRYRIDPANVIGHREAPGTRTECPGDVMQRYIESALRRAQRPAAGARTTRSRSEAGPLQ